VATKHFNKLVTEIIDTYAESQIVHANSLILTIFGDFVSAHGGTIWLGSLIKLVSRLGINQRLVRTSVFRLTEKGILQSKQVGRRSFYSLTDKGFRQYSSAAERIYRYHDYKWNGEWCLVFTTLENLPKKERERFQNELIWLGFNRLANGVYAHPLVALEEVHKVVKEMSLEDSVVVMQSRSSGDESLIASGNLIKSSFNVFAMKEEYQEHIDFFKGILKSAESSAQKSDEACFLIRLLLIHKYRRILMREPEIPHELMPAECLSHEAREITERLYKLICNQAEDYFMEIAESESVNLPEVNAEYFTRFGGIPPMNG
jgi:phenylacetic acid degradation operon negative regulatory protein